jgi:hypothetical protein
MWRPLYLRGNGRSITEIHYFRVSREQRIIAEIRRVRGMSLWDDDRSPPVLFLMPSVFHFTWRHPFSVDAHR